MNQKDARILLISPRLCQPSVCRCAQNEFEDVIAAVDSAELVSPPLRPVAQGGLSRRVLNKLHRMTRISISRDRKIEPVKVEGRYDMCFVVVQHPRDVTLLNSVQGWRERSAKAVVFIEEIWLKDLIYHKTLEPLKQFDHILTHSSKTCQPLQNLLGVPCEWEAAGVDMFRFCPHPENLPRTIDFLSMGRRSDKTHQALLELSRQKDFFYFYDTASFKSVLNYRDHRDHLANLIERSRYFLANKPKVNATEHRGDQEELGIRFMEGAAGGAVMVGDPPECLGFDRYMNWPDSVIKLPYDSTDVADFIADLDRQPDRLERIRRDNVVNSLRMHDWVYRWAHMLRVAGLEPTLAMKRRMEKLEELAASVAAAEAMELAVA